MKHFILMSVFSLLFGFASNAQQGYFTLAGAYAVGNNGVTHSMFEQSRIIGNQITVTAKRLTLGSGFNYRGDFRYYFNEYLGIGLQGTLVRGSWQTFSSERKIVYVQYTKQSIRSKGFALAAAFHARLGENSVIPYISLFPGYYAGTLDLADSVSYSGQVRTSTWEYTGMGTLFLSVATGVDFVVTDELNLFFEVEAQSMTAAPKRARLVVRDGSDQLQDVPVIEKSIVFMDEITSDYTQIPDENVPKKELKPYFPLDNFQIRIGLRVLLGERW